MLPLHERRALLRGGFWVYCRRGLHARRYYWAMVGDAMKQKRTGERRRRDNLRRRARHKVGSAGVFICAICGQYKQRRSLEIDHTNYNGVMGKWRLICIAHHRKKTKRER
jgi:hypothetical protein